MGLAVTNITQYCSDWAIENEWIFNNLIINT